MKFFFHVYYFWLTTYIVCSEKNASESNTDNNSLNSNIYLQKINIIVTHSKIWIVYTSMRDNIFNNNISLHWVNVIT